MPQGGQGILQKKRKIKIEVSSKNIEKYLGVQKYRFGLAEDHNQIGQVNGLAWTEVGGDLLTIEAAVVSRKGKTTYTGQLGEVMQEIYPSCTNRCSKPITTVRD